MRVLGIDPGSVKVGHAITERGELLYSHLYQTKFHGRTENGDARLLADAMEDYCDYTNLLIRTWRPDLVVIETVTSSINVDTIKKLSYYEALALVAVARVKRPKVAVTLARVQRVRKEVFGHGGLKKVKYADVCVRPNYGADLSLDECDAIALALYGERCYDKSVMNAQAYLSLLSSSSALTG
jgi:Holliday junction resolvasome RuvABC endonuclease subunit